METTLTKGRRVYNIPRRAAKIQQDGCSTSDHAGQSDSIARDEGRHSTRGLSRALRTTRVPREVSLDRTQAVIDALVLMMKLRDRLPYRGEGFALLNAACHRLSDRFWSEAEAAPLALRAP